MKVLIIPQNIRESNELCMCQCFENYKIFHKDLTYYEVVILVLQEEPTFFSVLVDLSEVV